ncbi:TPA: hypothetical protein ACGVAY_004348 [Vibrio vulnificus]
MTSSFNLTDDEERALLTFEASRQQQLREEREKENTVTLRLTGHEVMRRARLPLYFKARIQEMRMGDTFFMGSIRHLYDKDETGIDNYEGVAEVYVKKGSKGRYELYCTWCLLSKPSRPMIFAHVDFQYEKGGVFAFLGAHAKGELYNVCLVSRFIQRLIKHASPDDREVYSQLGLPAFLCGVNIDKTHRTTRQYFPRQKKENGLDKFRRVHYHFADAQMPKPMMECIMDIGLLTGVIQF